MLPEPQAKEIIELFSKSATDYDIRRAVMFLKLLRYSYSSSGKSFACQPFSIRSLFRLIEDVSVRMSNVVIENQDFQTLINHYDRKILSFIVILPILKLNTFILVVLIGMTICDFVILFSESREIPAFI